MSKETSRKVHRSPAYPSLTLPDAVARAATLFDSEKRNSFDPDVALSHWGYEAGSANGMRAVAALKQYGLLDENRGEGERELKLTELAIDVLMPEKERSKEHFTSLQDAALGPTLFNEVWHRHVHSGLPSDRNLERYLIKEKNFNPGSVARIIRILRETFDYAGLATGAKMEASEPHENRDNAHETQGEAGWQATLFPNLSVPASNRESDKTPTGPGMLELPLTLPSLKLAVFKIPAKMTEKDFQAMVSALNDWKEQLVEKPQTPKDVNLPPGVELVP